MTRRLWRVLTRPWRRDPAFIARMHDARCNALEQSRESLRQQRRLREAPPPWPADSAIFAEGPDRRPRGGR